MAYSTIEAAAVAVLAKHADYASSGASQNVSRGDYRILKKGIARVAIFTYGGLTTEDFTLLRVKHLWTINIDLLVMWPRDAATFEANLATERQKIIDTFLTWPALDATSGVLNALIRSGQEPDSIEAMKGALRGQRLLLDVKEIVDPNRSE